MRAALAQVPGVSREELVRKWDLNRDGKLDAAEFTKAQSIRERQAAARFIDDSVITAKVKAAQAIIESNQLMRRLGTVFTTMPATRPGVAMLYPLSQFIRDPRAMMIGTTQVYRGLKDDREVQALIDFLKAQ